MTRFALILVLAAGCSSKKQPDHGLPPAQEWGAEVGGTMPDKPQANNPHGGTPPVGVVDENGNDPHAGLDMGGAGGANPHAGLDMGDNSPHQGAKMGTDPHAAAGVDVSKLGSLAPDPNRAIDPTHHIRGLLKIHPKAADRAKAGTAIFLIVKQADATGQPTGTPLAVDKLTWQGKDLPFELTEGQAMIAGTQLVGDVVITARYDQDGDAISKQPGDIIGQLRVKIPSDTANLYLDTILP
ncbi:MAG: hypothetical protein ABI678_09385 [Kofleriaceae bacterium]